MQGRCCRVGVVCLAVGLGLMLFDGCSKATYQVVPVSGKVTSEGKGLANVIVSFQPMATEKNPNPGPPSVGVTGDDGSYELMLGAADETKKKGAVVGKHRVRFSRYTPPAQDDTDGAPPPKRDPALDSILDKLRDSPKEVGVPAGGTKEADFELKK